MARNRPSPPNDGLYRAILAVLVASVVVGAILALAGETVFGNPALGRVGTGLALVSAALYGFFRALGAREARRRGAKDRE